MATEMWATPDNDGKPITFTLKTDMPARTLHAIMEEAVQVTKAGNHSFGKYNWLLKLAASAIVEPAEYSGQEDKLSSAFSFATMEKLGEKLEEWYPFEDYVSEDDRDLMTGIIRIQDIPSPLDLLNTDSKQASDTVLSEVHTPQDLADIDKLLSSILNHVSQLSGALTIVTPQSAEEVAQITQALEHVAPLKDDVERIRDMAQRFSIE